MKMHFETPLTMKIKYTLKIGAKMYLSALSTKIGINDINSQNSPNID